MQFFLIVVNALLIAASLYVIFGLGVSGLILGIWLFTLTLSVFNMARLLID